jgi:hypothetical protein
MEIEDYIMKFNKLLPYGCVTNTENPNSEYSIGRYEYSRESEGWFGYQTIACEPYYMVYYQSMRISKIHFTSLELAIESANLHNKINKNVEDGEI